MAHVTIPDQDTFVTYPVTTSTTGPFVVPFAVFAKADITVLKDGVDIGQPAFSYTPTSSTTGGYQTGTISLGSAVEDCEITLYRNILPVRTSDMGPGPKDRDADNTQWDRFQAQLQDARRDLDRSFKADFGETPVTQDLANVAAVAAIASAIEQVADIDAEVVIVADAMEAVEEVADNMGDVNAVADALGNPSLASALPVTSTGGIAERTLADRFGERLSLLDQDAAGDGVTDDAAAWQLLVNASIAGNGRTVFVNSTANGYILSASARMGDGDSLTIEGVGRPVFKRSGNNNFITSLTSGGTRRQIKRLHLKGLVFDGGWDLSGSVYPYRDQGVGSTSTAIHVQGDITDPDSECIIEDCEFHNFKASTCLIQYFSRVVIKGNKYSRTWDWIIQQCKNVVFEDNTGEHIPEMGVSIIEDNQIVRVRGNKIFGSAGHGISVDNFISQQLGSTGTAKVTEISGGGYGAGARLTLTLDTNGFLTDDQIGQTMYLADGSDGVLLRIEESTNSQLGIVRAVDAVPAALQDATTTTFFLSGPGNKDVQIHDNTLVGCELSSIACIRGFKHVKIYDNQILFQGITPDSEVYTTCTGTKGSTTLDLADATGFAIGRWFMIRPQFGVADIFVAKISNLVGTVATISKALPTQYLNDTIYLAWHSVDDLSNTLTSAGIEVYGLYRNDSGGDVALAGEDAFIYNNTVRNFVYVGVKAGGTNINDGRVKDVHVRDNKLALDDYFDAASATTDPVTGIFFTERNSTVGRNTGCSIINNIIRVGGLSIPPYIARAYDGDLASRIDIWGNIHDSATAPVVETTASATLMLIWGVQEYLKLAARGLDVYAREDSAIVDVGVFRNGRTGATSDIIRHRWYMSDDAGTLLEVGRQQMQLSSAAAGAVSSRIIWAVMNAGSLSSEAVLSAISFAPFANDGLALGSAATAFSDLFLASGAVINFNNGDVTITHASNKLTLGGGDLELATGFRLDLPNSQTTVGAAGAASALPATPTGYIPIKVAGTEYVVPYYAKA